MNKFERQGPQSASHQTLPEAVARDLTQNPAEVLDLSDLPPLAPRAALT